MASRVEREGLCGICPAGCWVKIGLEDEQIVSVEPADHPLGAICPIGRQSPSLVYDPDRLRTPMLRRGPKGTQDFVPISWDEAYERIVERLEGIKAAHGAEATGIYTGRGSFDMAMCDLLQPADVAVSSASSVLFPFGSPNTLGVGALCYVSFAMIAPHTTLGEMYMTMDHEVDQADLIVVWGANPATDSPPTTHERILRARRRGAQVVVIDPRRTRTAREAEAQWIPIRPGTDGALALGLIHVLVDEERLDERFARRWTVGFDDLVQRTQHYRPEVVEGITGVSADTIRDLARRIAAARGACPIMYTGLEYSDSGVQAIRAVLCLWALAGQLDVPGGLVIRMRGSSFPQNRSRLIANPGARRALGRDRFPIYSLYRGESHAIALPRSVLEGHPYRVRAMLVLGASIITSWPNPDLWRRTLGALEFLVCINRYPTADTAYADILLPSTTQYETTSYMRYGPLLKIRERIIAPVGEARNDFLILSELARRLGYGHLFPQSEEEILRLALDGSGFTLEEVRAAGGSAQIQAARMQYRKWEKGLLRDDGQPGFATPSGKLEIASSILAEHGYEPLPLYTEPQEGPLADPVLARRFPLVFNSGARTAHEFRSQHHGVAPLAAHAPEPVVTLNSDDARARGIASGDLVRVETLRGRQVLRARVTDDIVAGAIDASMGGGGPLGSAAWQGCNINDLTDLERCDPISGFPVYKSLLCEVTRMADGGAACLVDGGQQAEDEPAVAAVVVAITRPTYLDCNASTPLGPEARAAMLPFLLEEYGNPSSIHTPGARARAAVDDARRKVAQLAGCAARRLTFTGSGTEADNLAIRGMAHSSDRRGRHLVTTAIEHPAVLQTCRSLEREGFEVTYLPVGGGGLIDPDAFARSLRPDTLLASVMLANNETGDLQPIGLLARLAHERGVLLHTDAVQALGKIPVDLERLGVDLASLSAHKIGGPKGVGALFLRRGLALHPTITGGGQEQGLRAGTENVAGIVGFGAACQAAERRINEGEATRIAALRDRLEQGVLSRVRGARRNGGAGPRLPNTTSLSLPGIRGESLVLELDRRGVYLSSGSACKSGSPDPSHVLLALGLSVEQAHCTVRLSLGPATTGDDIDHALACLDEVLRDTWSQVRFVGCR